MKNIIAFFIFFFDCSITNGDLITITLYENNVFELNNCNKVLQCFFFELLVQFFIYYHKL